MGNEASKAKMEAFRNEREQSKQQQSTVIPPPGVQPGVVGDVSSIRSDASSSHSGFPAHRTDTISSGNSADSETKHKIKRKPFKTAKDFLLNANKTPWSQEKSMYRSDQASSCSSLQHKSITDGSIDGVRTSFSSTNITTTGSEHNYDDEEWSQSAERRRHAGHELMGHVFTLEAYHALFNRLFLAPVEDYFRSGAHVLHIGCGSADWSVEMAKRYTDVTFHAVDTARYIPSSRQQRHAPKNVSITVVRALDRIPYGDQTFDYVMCRFLTFRIERWRSLVDEMVRLTKSGCYIELCEPDFVTLGSAGPATRLLADSLARMMLAYDRDPLISDKLEGLLSQSESLLFVSSQAAFISLSCSDVAHDLFSMTINELGRYLTDWKPPGVAQDALMAQYVKECKERDGRVAVRSAFAQRSRLM